MVEIPEGFTPHDGGECPVDPLTVLTGTLFRDSFLCTDQILAGAWICTEGNLWRIGSKPGPADIIAYRVETSHD